MSQAEINRTENKASLLLMRASAKYVGGVALGVLGFVQTIEGIAGTRPTQAITGVCTGIVAIKLADQNSALSEVEAQRAKLSGAPGSERNDGHDQG